MHELTVAIQIRNAIETELAADNEDLIVDSVHVQVGALTGIVPEALDFAWPHAVSGTPNLASARLVIDWVDALVHCSPCAATYTISTFVSLRCPVCRSPDVELTGGDELDILSVDVREQARGPA